MEPPTGTRQLDPWRYIVLFSKCGFSFIHLGSLKAYGVLIPSLTIELNTSYSTIGFIASLQFTVTFLACPLAQQLARRFGTRLIATLGGVLATIPLILTWFCTSAATMGLLFCISGLGASMLYQTSHVSLKEHFGDRFGAVITFSMLFATLGSMFMSYVSSVLLEAYGPRGTLLLISAMTAHHIVFGATFKPPEWKGSDRDIANTRSPNSARSHGDEECNNGTSSEPCLRSVDRDETIKQNNKSLFRNADTDNELVIQEDNMHPYQCLKTTKRFVQILLSGVKRFLAIDALRQELAVVLVLFPSQILFDIAFTGWCLFVVPFGLSVGLDSSSAPLLAIAGAAGGFVTKGIVAIVLHFKPSWGFELYCVNILTFLVALLLYSAGFSLWYLLCCSFLAGLGLFGATSSFLGALSTSVSKENFPDILAVSFLITGSGIPLSGALTGYLYDVTQSFTTVFLIYAGMLIFGLILCTAYLIYRKVNTGVNNVRKYDECKD